MNPSTAQVAEALTFEMLQEVAASLKDPLRQFMVDKGYNPDDGWVLILPEKEGSMLGEFVPDYVRISKLVESPITINGSSIGIGALKSFNHE